MTPRWLVLLVILLTGGLAVRSALAADLLERTAVQALKAAKHSPTGMQVEHGGMIISRQTASGRVLEYIEPTGDGDPTSVTVLNRKLLGPDDELVATYHIHLCMDGYIHAYFSTADVITAVFSSRPEFMLDSCTGLVHEFDPAVDKVHGPGSQDFVVATPDGNGKLRHLPSGRIIGDIGETEPMGPDPYGRHHHVAAGG